MNKSESNIEFDYEDYEPTTRFIFMDYDTLYNEYNSQSSIDDCTSNNYFNNIKRRNFDKKFKRTHGFDRSECYIFCKTIAEFALPRLIHIRNELINSKSKPCPFLTFTAEDGKESKMSFENWIRILEHIINSLNMIRFEDIKEYSKEEYDYMLNGIEKFGQYLYHITL